MSGPAQVIIVGEDHAHVGSIYRAVVDHLGVPAGKVRKRPVVGGQGDAKQFVLQQIPGEIKLLRRGPQSTALIIAVDGDDATVDQRMRKVSAALTNASVSPINPSERAVVLVPCRNIETWLEFARCAEVDEQTNYKRGRRSRWSGEDFAMVGRVLAQSPAPKDDPPASLARAYKQLREMLVP